jgi:exopolysaccharide biosynthesis predicted pyruvyltransferase EpsI
MIDEQTSISVGRHTSVPSKVSYEDILKTCHIFCSTVIYNTEYFGKLYMPDILKRQDFALWLRMLKQIDFAHSIDEVLMLYRIRKESVSSNKIKAARYQWRVYRDEEKLSLISSFYYFINYAYFGIKKYKGK